MDRINQGTQGTVKIVQTKKTVDWMTHHTSVNVFDPLTFKGYQRSIDGKHCDKIVAYLKKNFFLPTAVICASRVKFNEDLDLYIVDGQHRVEALKRLKESDLERYNKIKDYELSVIVLEEAGEEVEIDTFITINKTSKKVDTSLAYVLKNRINYNRASVDISISKREYLAVELARVMNTESELWGDKILFEGQPKQTPQLISLNAFVVSMRSFLYALQQRRVIPQDWHDRSELSDCISSLRHIVDVIWMQIRDKWPELFCSDLENRRIIQGSIGFSSINKYLGQRKKATSEYMSSEELTNYTGAWIQDIRLAGTVWLPGGSFSKYSSASGYSIIAQELLDSTGLSKQ